MMMTMRRLLFTVLACARLSVGVEDSSIERQGDLYKVSIEGNVALSGRGWMITDLDTQKLVASGDDTNDNLQLPSGSYLMMMEEAVDMDDDEVLEHEEYHLLLNDEVVGVLSNHEEHDVHKLFFRLPGVEVSEQRSRSLEESASFSLKVLIQPDAFPDENTWTLYSNVDGIYRPILHKTSAQSDSVLVTPGDYAFEMTDSSGDGVCCQFGLGTYRVFLGTVTGRTIYFGGEFGSSTGLLPFTVLEDGTFSRPDLPAPGPQPVPPPTPSPTVALIPTSIPTSRGTFESCPAMPEFVSFDRGVSGTNREAPILQPDSPAAPCTDFWLRLRPRILFYELSGDGRCYEINTIGSNFDTLLVLLEGGDCDTSECVDFNDDFYGLQSRIILYTEIGATYWLVIGGFNQNSVGEFLINFEEIPCTGQPSPAPTISFPPTSAACPPEIRPLRPASGSIRGSNVRGSTLDFRSPVNACIDFERLETSFLIYFQLVGNGDCFALDTFGSSFDTVLGVLVGEECVNANTCVTSNDDVLGLRTSRVSFESTRGENYWIVVGGFNEEAVGDFVLTITAGSCTTEPTYSPTSSTESPTAELLWTQLGSDFLSGGDARGSESGSALALSSNGDIVAIGTVRANSGDETNSGRVQVFQYNGVFWGQLGSDIDGEAAEDQSGWAVDLSDDGLVVAIGAVGNRGGAGHVRVFEYENESWGQLGEDIDGAGSSDFAGISVAISGSGNIVAVGANLHDGPNGPDSGHVRVFEFNSQSWVQRGDDIFGEATGDMLGFRVDISSDGNVVAVGGWLNDLKDDIVDSGHVLVYLFDSVRQAWSQFGQELRGGTTDEQFGLSVSLSAAGDVLAIGSNSGVNVYESDGSPVWISKGQTLVGDDPTDEFGRSVAISGDGEWLAIGAPFGPFGSPGEVTVFRFDLERGQWEQFGEPIVGENSFDRWGVAVAISSDGGIVAGGAPGYDGPNDNTGHARVFDRNTD